MLHTVYIWYEIQKIGKSIKTESTLLDASDWGGAGKREWLLNGYGVFLWGDENVLELDRGGGCMTLWTCLNATELFTIKLLILCCMNLTSIFENCHQFLQQQSLKCCETRKVIPQLFLHKLFLLEVSPALRPTWDNWSRCKQHCIWSSTNKQQSPPCARGKSWDLLGSSPIWLLPKGPSGSLFLYMTSL